MNDFREYRGYTDYYGDSLMHFGIIGMKWGVRRYQNPDGTLTAAGKARYDKLKTKSDEYYKKAEKYGKETPVEKAGRQITNYVNFEKENGFKKSSWDPNVSVKTATVKDSNGKNKKIDFCIDFDRDLEKIGDNSKDVKNTFDDFEKYYRQHELEIKRQAKEQILGKIKEHNLGPEDTEYFTKMANNIGNKGFMQVSYQSPDQVTIDIDDGVDDLFLPSIDYDVNEQKVKYIRMND